MLVQAQNLTCPLDGLPLEEKERQFCCPNGHSFDRARQGYVNLLPVQNKRSRAPGDSKEMVEARTRFLNSGIYTLISDRLNKLVVDEITSSTKPCVVDAGCGEGYYLHRLADVMNQNGYDASLIGFDISKPAIIAAAKRSKQITWLVASNKSPVIQSDSVDVVVSMFGFPDYLMFASLLKPGGSLLLVDAAEDHLIELREIIYPEVKRSPPPNLAKAEQLGMKLINEQRLTYTTDPLDKAQLTDLLVMTPHLYRASREGREAAALLESLAVTVDVSFRLLRVD